MGAILIVDDERNIRETVAMYIRILGHTVETAADGETAMEAIDRREFDLVVSDIRMEGLGGLGLLRQIREQQGDTAVVLMTRGGYRSHPREMIGEILDNGQLDWSHFFVVEEGYDVTLLLSNRRLDSTRRPTDLE